MKIKIAVIFILCVLLTCSCTNQKNDKNTEISSESVFVIQDRESEIENETKSEDINLDENPEEDTDSESVLSFQNDEKETETKIDKENIDMEEKPVEDTDSALQIEQQKVQSEEEDISNQITISLTNSNIETKSLENITVIVKNDSMYDITAGDEYWISKLNGEQWENIPMNIAWNDLGIQIKAGSFHEFNYNLNLFGTFEKDVKYRITKKVYMNQKEYILATDFTVN